jgi:FixJ family two-component response regulator
MSDFISKPVRLDDLRSAIERALEKRTGDTRAPTSEKISA